VIETEWSARSLPDLQDRLAAPLPPREPPRPETARERGRMAERLVPVALELSGLVHGDGDQAAIGEFLADLTPRRKDALLVVAAALIPQDAGVAGLLSWIDFDEAGRPLTEVNDQRKADRERRLQEMRGCLDRSVPLEDAAASVGVAVSTARIYRTQINKQRRDESEAAA
jgi:hypothetical protein